MADQHQRLEHEMQEEGDSSIGAPGLVATKSQAQGGLAGVLLGAILGAVLGLLIGLVFFGGEVRNVVIAVVAFAVGGGTFGSLAGGFLWPRRKVGGTGADK